MKSNKKIWVRLANGYIVRAFVPGKTSPAKRSSLTSHRKVRKADQISEALAGQYVAWSSDGLRIKGHGKTIAEAREMAREAGCARMVIQKIPSTSHFRPANSEAGRIKEVAEPEKV